MAATATSTAPGAGDDRVPWKAQVRPYAQPIPWRTGVLLATSVVPYLALLVVTYLLLQESVWLALAISPLTAAFLLRTFVVFHDCTHGSLFATKRANRWVGTVLGILVYQPFEAWRHSHAVHHATAGDLDRRGTGDLPTLTVEEYRSRSPRARLAYRLFRNPLVMFGLGPILSAIVVPRLVPKDARPRVRRSIIVTNLVLLAIVVAACLTIGVVDYLVVQWPAAWMASSAGIFLFYVQHQFEDAYWERGDRWEYADAAIRGSSFLKLNPVLRFFSASIGYHHVHHLSARIPSYSLRRAHEEIDLFRDVPVLTLGTGLRCTRLKLYDEREGRLVTWAEAKAVPTH